MHDLRVSDDTANGIRLLPRRSSFFLPSRRASTRADQTMSLPTDQDPVIPPEDSSLDRISPQEALPDVRPPSAGFVVQLFIIPGVIVFVIVMVWLLFNWLALMGGNPSSYLTEMRRNNANSWQQAYNLSEAIRQNDEYRSDVKLATEIAVFLDELLEQPIPAVASKPRDDKREPHSEEITRRGFLCRTLGEFHIAEPTLPVLMKAAAREDGTNDVPVQLAALEAIALLAEHATDREAFDSSQLLALLLASSRHEDYKIRLRAALALSSVGGDQAVERLTKMLDEPQHVDVHYNVATNLARHGKPECLAVLQEMLDPNETRAIANEPSDDAGDFKRRVILLNGLKALQMLAAENPTVDLSVLVEPVAALTTSDLGRQIRVEAATTLSQLQKR